MGSGTANPLRPGYLRDLKTIFQVLHVSASSVSPKHAGKPVLWHHPSWRSLGQQSKRRKWWGQGCSLTYWNMTGTGDPESWGLRNLQEKGTFSPVLVSLSVCARPTVGSGARLPTSKSQPHYSLAGYLEQDTSSLSRRLCL